MKTLTLTDEEYQQTLNCISANPTNILDSTIENISKIDIYDIIEFVVKYFILFLKYCNEIVFMGILICLGYFLLEIFILNIQKYIDEKNKIIEVLQKYEDFNSNFTLDEIEKDYILYESFSKSCFLVIDRIFNSTEFERIDILIKKLKAQKFLLHDIKTVCCRETLEKTTRI